MVDRALMYAFEGISDDLPRPPMAALRALLNAGVLISARAWQELPLPTRQAIARAGAAEQLVDSELQALLRQIPVSSVKFVGKRNDPPAHVVPQELATALGPSRPLTEAEWRGLRALDRHVLESLVKNTRLLSRALNEVLPNRGPSPGTPHVWSGAVARAELRVRRDVLQRVLSVEFMDGQAFVLSNVSGRRAARRASELFDQQAECTVGPVEIDWGMRSHEDILYWQAHVSAWDGTFFPVASLLAASTAATAMFDLVKTLDSSACIVFAGIREEPWQAGRDEQHDAPTGLYAKPVNALLGMPVGAVGHDTIQMTPRESSPLLPDRSIAYAQKLVPPPPSSSPSVASSPSPASSTALSSLVPSSGSRSRNAGGPPAKSPSPKWVGAAIVGLIVLLNLLVIYGIAIFLAGNRR